MQKLLFPPLFFLLLLFGGINTIAQSDGKVSPFRGGGRVALIQAIYNQQNRSIRFSRYSLEEGLSQSVVNCISQDSKGFIWIGTQDGLNRFDGYKFTHYKHDPKDPQSISHNNILAILEDSQGMLWIGTYGGRTEPV